MFFLATVGRERRRGRRGGLAALDLVDGAEAVAAGGGLALGQWAVVAGGKLTGHVGSTPYLLS